MISLETWIAFCVTEALLCFTLGPARRSPGHRELELPRWLISISSTRDERRSCSRFLSTIR